MPYSLIFKIFIIYILIITPSYAYLDPGTGSIIVQALVASFVFLRTQIRSALGRFNFLNLNNNFSNNKKIFLSIIILSIPVIDFLNTNYLQVDKVVIFQCLIVFAFNIFIFLIFFFLFKIFK